MKTHQTIAGNTYCVTSPNGGTVTDASGSLNKPVDAGDQLTVVAPSGELYCDDDAATIVKANFKRALAALGLLGGGNNGLPAGYARVEFLESTGTQFVRLSERKIDGDTAWQMKAMILNASTSGVVLDAKASNASRLGVVAFDSGKWRFDYGNSVREVASIEIGALYELEFTTDRKCVVNGESLYQYGRQNFSAGSLGVGIFAEPGGNYKTKGRIYYVRSQHVFDCVPALDSTGAPCMFDLVTKKPFRNNGSGQFIAGLSMKQARNLAKLPATGGSLTISLPKEASLVQHNQQVEAALNTAAEKGWNIPVQYRDEFDDSSIENKYAECVSYSDMYKVNPEFMKVTDSFGEVAYHTLDLTSDGDFPYNLPKLNCKYQHWVNGGFFRDVFVEKFSLYLPALTDATSLCCMCKSKEIYFDAPKATRILYVFSDCMNLEKATFTSSPMNIERICFSWGSMALREIYGDFTKVTNAKQAFYHCQLNKETVLRICSELPTASNNPITIGIHVDHQTDEEITEALANLETKGWEVVVQWRGTPTAQAASTFGLRKPPIYAKLGEMEYPDGTIKSVLDWGHYVSNWEENGYMEFASIEEAEEHFNIKKEITE